MRPRVLYLLISLLAACSPSHQEAPVQATDTTLPETRPVALFLGTSLTAGYGLTPDLAYPARIQKLIDAAGWRIRVVNAGVSGDTSASGLRRIDWLLDQPVGALILELGANDMLRGQNPSKMRENLQKIIDRTRAAHPKVEIIVAGMRAARNLGMDYAREFERVYPELALANQATLIPFLLEGVAAVPSLNQADGLHPTAEGHAIISATIWPLLAPVLERVDF